MNRVLFYVLTFSFLLFTACSSTSNETDPLSHIQNAEVKALLERVFEAHGGSQAWQDKPILKYNKKYTLLKEDGSVEKSAEQFHHYVYQPKKIVKIVSIEGKDNKQLILNNGKVEEIINGAKNLEADQTALMNKLESSLFVINMPFKLADEGVNLSLELSKEIDGLGRVLVLKAVYDPANQKHHTTPDTWWLYFDPESYIMYGYMVQHKDHFSMVRDFKAEPVNGFVFPEKRKSYRVDENGNALYLRADYEYSGFDVGK